VALRRLFVVAVKVFAIFWGIFLKIVHCCINLGFNSSKSHVAAHDFVVTTKK